MSIAFWSQKLTKGKPIEVQAPEGYVLNIQQAALGEDCGDNSKHSFVLHAKTVSIDGDDIDAVIGTLRPITCDQTNISLVFGFDVPTTFVLAGSGKGTLHLSGYFQPGPDDDEEEDMEGLEGEDFDSDMDSEDMDSDSGDEDEEGLSEKAALYKSLAGKASGKSSDNGKLVVEPFDDNEATSSDDDDDEDVDDEFIAKMIRENGGDDDDEDSDEDSGESESESEEEIPPMKVQKVVAKGQVTPGGKNKAQSGSKPNTPANKQNTPSGNNNKQNTPNNNKNNNKNNKNSDKKRKH
jgi:hypothetical protein